MLLPLWTMVFTDTMLIKTYNLSLSCKLIDAIFSVTMYSYWSYYLKDNKTKYIGFEDKNGRRGRKEEENIK